MPFYRTCQFCDANLDPGERCGCDGVCPKPKPEPMKRQRGQSKHASTAAKRAGTRQSGAKPQAKRRAT